MTAISTNYRELTSAEVPEVAARCAEAWQSPEIPLRQYESCVKGELERWRRGESIAPFDKLVQCWRSMDWAPNYYPSLLDVGASSGYYREVLKERDIRTIYTGCDYSPSFGDMARRLFPGMLYDIADATNLPYEDNAFDIVLHSACIMHMADYEKAIAEAARVARRFVIFHRTPIVLDGPTRYFEKEAYGVPCLEIHFNELDLLCFFEQHRLSSVRAAETIFWDALNNYGHRIYVLEKQYELPHYPV